MASVDPVLGLVLLLDVAARVLGVHLNSPSKFHADAAQAQRLLDLQRQHPCGLLLDTRLRERCSAGLPFTAFTDIQIAVSIFLKLSMWKANTVPEVTENSRRQSGHLNLRSRTHRIAAAKPAVRADWITARGVCEAI